MQNDADVVHAPRDGRTLSYRNVVYGAVLFLIGLGGLIAGVVVSLVVIGVIGFVLMLGGVVLAVTPTKGSRGPRERSHPSTADKPAPSFMDRMNDRWDRRQEDR